MGTYGTYTGAVLWYDPDSQKGRLLLLQDGEIQSEITDNQWYSLATGYNEGSGFWMDTGLKELGSSASSYLLTDADDILLFSTTGQTRVFIGSAAGDNMRWDGNNLIIEGQVTVTGGNAAKVDLSNVTGYYAGSNAVAGSANNTLAVGALPTSTVEGWAHVSDTTTIDGGDIYTGSITAAKITVANLSALSANMGSLTAGSIVIGTTDKLWLNDSADGALNIGGATKASAPFGVTAAGVLTATGATISGTIKIAADNVVLDAGGFTLHDMAGASIATPTFGVGPVMTLIGSKSENFSTWTAVGTAAVTADTTICPNGVEQVADTVALPAVNDAITYTTEVAARTLADGETGIFAVWLKAAAAGTIQLTVNVSGGGASLATEDVTVETSWRRRWLTFTNNTGGAIQVTVGIKRNASGQLASVYAWGANAAFGFDYPLPYFPNAVPVAQVSTAIRGPLHLSTANSTFSVVIGTDWQTGIPSGVGVVAIGDSTGDGSTAAQMVALGHSAGATNSGAYLIALGENAGSGNTGENVLALMRNAGQNNTYNSVVLIGYGAAATAANQFVAGADSTPFSDVYFGKGVAVASPGTTTVNATGGSGTNIAGGALKLAGGKGTGSGAGGSVVIQTASAGSSGTTAGTLADRLTVRSTGEVEIANWLQFPEISEPSAPSSNYGRLYVKDNGSGKSQLCVRFASGAVQVIATEP